MCNIRLKLVIVSIKELTPWQITSFMQDMDHSDFQGCYAEHRVSVHSVSNEDTTFIFKTPQTLNMKVVLICSFDMIQISHPANQYNKLEDLNLQHVI